MKKNNKLTSQIDEVSNLRYNINLKYDKAVLEYDD